jgi:hypothetical protein
MSRKIKYDFHELRTQNPKEYQSKVRRLQGKKPLIKYDFHNLRTIDPIEYQRRFREVNPEYYTEASRKYWYKNWNNRNCRICGRFCSKGTKKYCNFCREMMYWFNHCATSKIRYDQRDKND